VFSEAKHGNVLLVVMPSAFDPSTQWESVTNRRAHLLLIALPQYPLHDLFIAGGEPLSASNVSVATAVRSFIAVDEPMVFCETECVD